VSVLNHHQKTASAPDSNNWREKESTRDSIDYNKTTKQHQ